MSNLSNLYISESYYGVVNLIDSTEPFASQSEGRIYLTDGVGENLGLSLDYTKRVSIDNGLTITGSLLLSGSYIHTGSIDVLGDITASGTVSAGTGSFDTINARVLNVTIESSSVILSSGSNQIGDEITDVQTIVGQTSISGSLTVIGPHSHTGDINITGSLFVSNEISSSTINGIGNVTTYSASVDSRINNLSSSVDSRLDYLEGPFSSSVDARLDALEAFSSSLVADFVTDVELSSALEVVTSSLQNEINKKLDTGSYDIDSASFDTRINTKLASSWTSSVFTPFSSSVDSRIITNASNITSLSSSIAVTDFNQQQQINSLIAETSSYARLDTDNTFENNNFFSGSVRGSVYNIIPVSNTASIDCSQGNFFTLEQATSNDYLLKAINITGGRTITLRINKTNPGGTFSIDTGSIKFPSGFSYTITTGDNRQDVLTFVSFDTGSLYGVASKNFV